MLCRLGSNIHHGFNPTNDKKSEFQSQNPLPIK